MELVMESIVGPLVNVLLVANLSLTGAGTALSFQIPIRSNPQYAKISGKP